MAQETEKLSQVFLDDETAEAPTFVSSLDALDQHGDQAPSKAKKRPVSSNAKKRKVEPTTRKPKKEKLARYSNGRDTQTLTQFRRALGDEFKKRIWVNKGGWACSARTHSVMKDVPNNLFMDLMVPNATSIEPSNICHSNLAEYDVVLASVDDSDKIGEIFGPSKIKPCNTTGTRFGNWYADKMDLVYLPRKNELRCWWTMSEPEHKSWSHDPLYPRASC